MLLLFVVSSNLLPACYAYIYYNVPPVIMLVDLGTYISVDITFPKKIKGNNRWFKTAVATSSKLAG
jgi:hypothetical protein